MFCLVPRPVVGLILLSCVLTLIPATAAAQQLVAGWILADGDSSAVEDAIVILQGGSLSAPLEVRTDASGRFVLAAIEPGEYRIVVTATGHLDYQAQVRIRPRQSSLPRIRLQPATRVREQVLVTTSPQLEARQYSSGLGILPLQVDELPPGHGGSFAQLVPSLSASAVTSHDNLVHLRGNELSLHMAVNGVSFLDNTHPHFSPSMAPDDFQSIELMTGGFAAEFGNRFGGILDLQTRTGFGRDGHGSVALAAGTLSRANAALQWGNHDRRFGWFVSGHGATNDRFLNPPQPGSLHNRGNSAQGLLRFDYRAGLDTLSLLVQGGGADFDLPNTAEQQELGRDAFKTTAQETVIARWDRLLSSNATLSVAGYQRFARETNHPTNDPATVLADGARSAATVGLKLDVTRGARRHAVKAGFDLMSLSLHERLALETREGHQESVFVRRRRLAASLLSSGGGDIDELHFASDRNGSLLSAYLQDELQLPAGFVANFGLRVDRFQMVGTHSQLSPRVNLAYDPGDGLRLHAAYNRFFSPPPIEFLLLSSLVAPADASPQPVPAMSANHFEAGVGWRLGRTGVVDLTGFYRRSRNAFETGEIADARVFVPVTFAHDEARGLELGLRLGQAGAAGLSGYANYTLSKTEFVGPVSGGLSDEELEAGTRIFPAFDQRHTVTAGLRYRHAPTGFYASARFEYGSGTPVEVEEEEGEGQVAFRRSVDHAGEAPQFERVDSHFLIGLSVGADLWRNPRYRLTADLHLENLTDALSPIAKESELTPVQFGIPRAFTARLRLVF